MANKKAREKKSKYNDNYMNDKNHNIKFTHCYRYAQQIGYKNAGRLNKLIFQQMNIPYV